ncbi:DUF1800 domain-containing protein [Herbihabitans rhizosphaerae]|uniref:DUF1800 domain-containing protein n=1 Tax=Herbihabitans rhizosphaerae TaxID=1872711 RepID=UPI00102B8AAF|nr:DUF1800 domain-containing protein [Herbihabitans rhizosphaerae]
MATLDDPAAVRRLIDRLGFGPRPGELATGVRAGYAATARRLLAPAADPGATATPLPDLGPEPDYANKDKEARQRAREVLRDQRTTAFFWWLDRMSAADVPLTERLTWFWHGHFATSAQKVNSARLMLAQNETMRRLGTGDFRALCEALIVDPAMIIWLDGQRNKIGKPNENLAREFMELFTLGIGNYSEKDVQEAARALTGWQVDRRAGTVDVRPKQHDARDKTVLGSTANLDAVGLARLLADQPRAPRFVAERLWFRLVSGTPPARDVVDRLTAAYGPNRDVRAMVDAITREPAFRDSANTLVKEPVLWAVGLMRALRVRPSALPPQEKAQLNNYLKAMGQQPFLPPTVGGWPDGAAWLSTSAGLARMNLARLIARRGDLGPLTGARDKPTALRELLGVDAWSQRTSSALGKVAGSVPDLVAVAACAPEYVVSG